MSTILLRGRVRVITVDVQAHLLSRGSALRLEGLMDVHTTIRVRRAWARFLTPVVLATALSATPAVVRVAPASAAPVRTGTVVVTVKTPAGVPGLVRLTSNGRAKVVRKAAAGTSRTVRLVVPVGRWRVAPQQVRSGSALYTAVASASALQVRSGRTAAVTVTYRKQAPLGTIALEIRTPEGVPGTVRLTSGVTTRLATKAPEGTSSVVRLQVPAGEWRLQPEAVTVGSELYVGSATGSVLRVSTGRTATATATYSRAPTVRDLHVSAIEPTRVQLTWVEPSAGATYVVRRATGASAPAGPEDGTSVLTDGVTATDVDAVPGATYAYSVFARETDTSEWTGPVSTVVTTPSAAPTGETAAVVTNPATVTVTDPGVVTTSADDAGVTASVPHGLAPALGQPWVLPPDTGIPTGFLGTVVAVSPDGRSVQLEPAGLADAFDHLDIRVPSFADLALQAAAVAPSTSASSGRADRARRGVISCGTDFERDLDVERDLDPYGSLHATLAKTEFLGKKIPIGASFDGEFGVAATLEAVAEVEAGASCELDLPRIAVSFMAGPVPMVLTARPTGSVSVSGTATQRVGVTVSVGAQFDGYFGLGGEDYIDGDLVTSIDPYADVTVAGDLSMNIGAEVALGIGSGNPKAGALVGAEATFTALDARASAVLGQNCLEVSAQRSVSVSLVAKAWLGKLEKTASLDVPFLNGSADWGGSPWTYPNTCAPAEYRIASGTVDVSSSWAGGCSNTGWCDDGDPETSRSESFSETSDASLRVVDTGGEWVPRFVSDPEVLDLLHAPLVFNSWTYDAQQQSRWSAWGCSETYSNGTVGPVEFGGAHWETGVATAPLPDQGLHGQLLAQGHTVGDMQVGDWDAHWWWGSVGAWDTDWSNDYPRVPWRYRYSGSSACGWEPYESDTFHHNLGHLGAGHSFWYPDESRLASSDSTATPLDGCAPDACRWRVQGTDVHEHRSSASARDCACGVNGAGSTTVTWSFVVESRVPPPADEAR